MSLDQYFMFLAAGFVIYIAPGPSMMMVTMSSLNQGLKGGIGATLGVIIGTLLHGLLVALGIATLIESSFYAYTLLQLGGAGYLIYLGAKLLLNSSDINVSTTRKEVKPKNTFRETLLVHSLNPKALIFFLSFLPQFIDANAGNLAGQLLILNISMAVIAAVSSALYVLCATRMLCHFKSLKDGKLISAYIPSLSYMLMGVLTLLHN